ncbi:SMI1/KNR4 family protein [Kosakonia sp. BK9b]
MPVSCGKPLPVTEVQTLTTKYAITLPDDYQEFLKKQNGFVVKSPDYCALDFQGVDEGIIAFDALFGLHTLNENYDLHYHNDEFLDEIAFIRNAFIIGDDPGGNYYILVNDAGRRGVYYWDRTHLHAEDAIQAFAIPEQDECGNLYKLTPDFAAFYDLIAANTLARGMKINNDL